MANLRVLAVGGGGTGGSQSVLNSTGAGGGGAGQVVDNAAVTVAATTYTVTVGGSDQGSSFGALVTAAAGSSGLSNGTGGNSASGKTGGTVGASGAGGGGGDSANGSNGSGTTGGNAGAGTASNISGSSVTYAGGGGGGAGNGGSHGNGINGGGDGAFQNSNGSPGTANTGGGGGGGGYRTNIGTSSGGSGGSGVVIVSLVTANFGTCTATGSFTQSTSGANTIFTFTGNGTFTVVFALPTITTQAASSVGATSATANGNITGTGSDATCSNRGVVWDTASHGAPGNVAPGSSGYAHNINEAGSFSTGAFTESMSGLTPNLTYYYRPYASNTAGYAYGTEVSFLYHVPTVTTQQPDITVVTPSSYRANLNGTITSLNGGSNCDIEGFVYDTASRALPGDVAPGSSGYANNLVQGGNFSTGAFSRALANLAFGTTYYIRAFAHTQTGGGYAYGNEVALVKTLNGPLFLDLAATLAVSGYKWLTKKLYAAQQQFTVRPYFTAKIIDDSVKPVAALIAGNNDPYAYASSATTPDGNIVVAGFGSDGFVHFWKSRNVAAGWDKNIILDAGSSANAPYAANQVAIAVSDYCRDSYRIDVAYFTNFDGALGFYFGTNLGLVVWSSDDGGNTWYQQAPAGSPPGYAMSDLPLANYNHAFPLNLGLTLMKPRLVNNVMTSGVVYIAPSGVTLSSGYLAYDIKYAVSTFPFTLSNILAPVIWNGNIASFDWTLHSLDCYYQNGVDYIVFSGFRSVIDATSAASSNQLPNYSLWLTGILRRSSNSTPQVWLPPVPVISVGSATAANQNQFTFPKANVQNGYVDLVFQALTVAAISPGSTGLGGTTLNLETWYLQSKDGVNFSYPRILVDNTNQKIFLNGYSSSYVAQDSYYYLVGFTLGIPTAALYKFIKNNVVADVTQDIIGYSVQEAAGQPNSISLKIANQNNQWVGAAPTQPGAAAIARNSKIAVWQGYYNADSNPEAVPRSVFYIDDIQQQVSGTQNDLAITGRDWFKKLAVLTVKSAIQWIGSLFYNDVFDGTTLGNWNQVSGAWQQTANVMFPSTLVSGDMTTTLAVMQQLPLGSVLAVNIASPGAAGGAVLGGAFVYAFFIDANNWLRLQVYESGGAYAARIQFNNNGSKSVFGNPLIPFTWTPGQYLSFFIRQYDYYKWSFMYTKTAAPFTGNPLAIWNSATVINSTEVDLTSYFSSNANLQKPYSVGLGANGAQTPFQYFRYVQFAPETSLMTVAKSLAAKAGIMDTVGQDLFDEFLFTPNLTGQYTLQNRKIIVPPSGSTLNTDIGKVINNGELVFTAKVTPTNTGSGQQFGLCCVFRVATAIGSAPTNSYIFRIRQFTDGNGLSACRFERIYSGATYVFPSSQADDQAAGAPSYGSLNFDITQYRDYRIVMIDGWMYAYIDGIMVATWLDNNTDVGFVTSGTWGFQAADANSTVTVKNIMSPNFWKPMQSFSFNPGDDASASMNNLLQGIRGWIFSDLFGRMKFKLLSSSDQPNYTYNDQLWRQNVDQSDKEYVSEVIVYGTNVMATAQNASLMPGVLPRTAVIVDYSITTQSDAQAKANQELLNFNQYLNQYEPEQVMNVGSELLDAVTITNTGNNTTGVSGSTRVYSQTMGEGGGSNNSDYSIQIQTGQL